jgi:hypothetical protein
LFVFYVLLFSAPWYIPRYLAPIAVVLNVLLAVLSLVLLETFVHRLRPMILTALTVIAVIVPMLWLGRGLLLRYVDPLPIEMYVTHYALTKCLPQDAEIASFQSGVLEYFHPRTLNLDGKVNVEAARAVRSGQLDAYLSRRRPTYIVDWKELVDERLGSGALNEYVELATRVRGERVTVLWGRSDAGVVSGASC